MSFFNHSENLIIIIKHKQVGWYNKTQLQSNTCDEWKWTFFFVMIKRQAQKFAQMIGHLRVWQGISKSAWHGFDTITM